MGMGTSNFYITILSSDTPSVWNISTSRLLDLVNDSMVIDDRVARFAIQ